MSDVFTNPQPLTLPGFREQEKVVPRMMVYPPLDMNSEQWYDRFKKKFDDALSSNSYFPVFRSSHGEFTFAVGRRGMIPREPKKAVRYLASRVLRSIQFRSTFYSGTPGYGYETYRQWELPNLRRKFASQLKWITERGWHCLYLADRDAGPKKLQEAYVRWLDRCGVELSPDSYGHIFFIYALFHGPGWEGNFSGKNILIVTSDQPSRTPRLVQRLKEIGVKNLEFLDVSRSQALKDAVQAPLRKDPDLCIVGAGVGAANVIRQLGELPCPVVDAGFVLDTIAFPEMKARRIYCVNDLEWNDVFGSGVPGYVEKFREASG